MVMRLLESDKKPNKNYSKNDNSVSLKKPSFQLQSLLFFNEKIHANEYINNFNLKGKM